MSEVKTIKISPINVIMKVGEWHHSTEIEVYPKTDELSNIVWSSDKPNIATVNPVNGYVYAHNPGIAIVTATLKGEDVNACYTVLVENNSQVTSDFTLSGEKATNNSNRSIAQRCASYSDTAFGFSGTVYSYTVSGNSVTLQSGILSKTKPYNRYAAEFQSAIYDMAVIYDSFSPLQRQAWLILRGYGLLTSLSVSFIDAVLLVAGVDLKGQLESTILGMNEWYYAEERAKSSYSSF